MENVIAVEVRLSNGDNLYYLTWGRIQDKLDHRPVAQLVLNAALNAVDERRPKSSRVLWSLHPATAAPMFYEVYFGMCQRPIPFGKGYDKWRKKIDKRMRQGLEISFLGEYVIPVQPDEPDAVIRKL